MENSSFDNGFQFAWDATSLTLFRTCPYKYFLSMHLNWEVKEKSPHLIFGGAYASALGAYHKQRALGESHDSSTEYAVLTALRATWFEAGPWLSFEPTKTRATLIRTIVWYLENHNEQDVVQTVHFSDGTPAVELSFTFSPSFASFPSVILCGHMDRIVSIEDVGEFVQDQKTTKGSLSNYYFSGFKPDTQMSLYATAGRFIFSRPVKGVMIDAASIQVGASSFLRGFTYRNEYELDEFLKSIESTIAYATHCEETKFYPQNPTACGNYSGCEFRAICSMTPQDRATFLKQDFVQRASRWDPLKRR